MLLFSAFLFFPALFFLFSLLILVTAVFETMEPTLLRINHCNRLKLDELLSKFLLVVKVVFIFTFSRAYSLEPFIIAQKNEVKVLQVTDFMLFNNSNPEVLSVKKLEKNHSLILKGKKTGVSSISLWSPGLKKKHLLVALILDKKGIESIRSLRDLGLKVDIRNERPVIFGKIKNSEGYKIIKKIKDNHPDFDFKGVIINPLLKKNVLAELYQLLWLERINDVFCSFEEMFLQCFIPQHVKIGRDLNEHINNTFLVNLIQLKKPRRPSCLSFQFYNLSLNRDINLNGDPDSIIFDLKNLYTKIGSTKKSVIFDRGELQLLFNYKTSVIPLKDYTLSFGNNQSTTLDGGLLNSPTLENFFSGIELKFNYEKKNNLNILNLTQKVSFSDPRILNTKSNKTSSSSKIDEDKETTLSYFFSTKKSKSSSGPLSFIPFIQDFSYPSRNNSSDYIVTTAKIMKNCNI